MLYIALAMWTCIQGERYSSFRSNTIATQCDMVDCAAAVVFTYRHTRTHMKVKGVGEPSGGVNTVYCESVPVVSVVFPVGVSSQVH